MTRLALVPSPPVRRDSLGRRIGHNWWRALVMEQFNADWHHREERREDNHQMEPDEYDAAFPLPRLKDYLVGNAGLWRDDGAA